MFWSSETTSEISGTPAAPREGRGPVSERLREQLQDRLLVALDFATLGAYELTAPECDATLLEAEAEGETAIEPTRPAERRHERPKRVFLFAKAVPRCPEHDDAAGPQCDPVAQTSLRGAQRRRGRRRAGMARAAEQPCTWR
jgi:hypothetical protein